MTSPPAEDTLTRIRRAFMAPEPERDPVKYPTSGVLIPVFGDLDDLHILYTLRSEKLNSHAGEVSFPGGRVEPDDTSPLAAALRETHEEVGIPPKAVDVLGHLTDFTTFRGVLVCAYVGHVRSDPPTEPASPDEVAQLMLTPVRTLLDANVYEGRRVAWSDHERVVHYWRLPQATMWGITGELTARFLRRALGWQPPKPRRVIEQTEDFFP